jgi:hypothetical protein
MNDKIKDSVEYIEKTNGKELSQIYLKLILLQIEIDAGKSLAELYISERDYNILISGVDQIYAMTHMSGNNIKKIYIPENLKVKMSHLKFITDNPNL